MTINDHVNLACCTQARGLESKVVTVGELMAKGFTPPVHLAANIPGGDEYNGLRMTLDTPRGLTNLEL